MISLLETFKKRYDLSTVIVSIIGIILFSLVMVRNGLLAFTSFLLTLIGIVFISFIVNSWIVHSLRKQGGDKIVPSAKYILSPSQGNAWKALLYYGNRLILTTIGIITVIILDQERVAHVILTIIVGYCLFIAIQGKDLVAAGGRNYG